jgi:hypothetical protein
MSKPKMSKHKMPNKLLKMSNLSDTSDTPNFKNLEAILFASCRHCNLNPSFFRTHFLQGCQIFLGTIYQRGEKYARLPQSIPNGHKIYQMAIKLSKCPKICILSPSIARPSKIYRNCDFWSENTYTIWQPRFPMYSASSAVIHKAFSFTDKIALQLEK